MIARCKHCPAAEGTTCVAQLWGHRRFCRWASKPGDRRDYVAGLAMDPAALEARVIGLRGAIVAEQEVLDAEEIGGRPAVAGRVALPSTADLLALVRDCPHRGSVLPASEQTPGCRACELTRCEAGKGERPGAVTLADCLACVAQAPDPADRAG